MLLVLASFFGLLVMVIPVIQVKKIGTAKAAIQYQPVMKPMATAAIIKLYLMIRVSIRKLKYSIFILYLSFDYQLITIQRYRSIEFAKMMKVSGRNDFYDA